MAERSAGGRSSSTPRACARWLCRAPGSLMRPSDLPSPQAVGSRPCAPMRSNGAWRASIREFVDYGHHRVAQDRTLEAGEVAFGVADLACADASSRAPVGVLVHEQAKGSCAGRARERPPVEQVFSTHECGEGLDRQATGRSDDAAGISSSYALATGIRQWAKGIFARFSSLPVVPDTAEDLDRSRRRWGTLYDGGWRVRHDPVDDWDE